MAKKTRWALAHNPRNEERPNLRKVEKVFPSRDEARTRYKRRLGQRDMNVEVIEVGEGVKDGDEIEVA